MGTVTCYIGGRSVGNPGRAAIGAYITDESGSMMQEVAETIGNSTDTFAEYQAVLTGLQTLVSLLGAASKTTTVELRLVSELVRKQLNAELPIKEPGLVPLFIEIHNMRVESFPLVTLTPISLEENSNVNRLISEAMAI